MVKRRASSVESEAEQQRGQARRLTSLRRVVSPPPSSRRRKLQHGKSIAAAVEAGDKEVEDHFAFYSKHLLDASKRPLTDSLRISHGDWVELYRRNEGNDRGCHFVVHQHDHPVAGTHYDLRLQCNATSSISFAIMYGLPGDPNSQRQNRNATETRVHCLWNHLIEAASHATGSMLIWDTGEYEVLPYAEGDNVDTKVDSEGENTNGGWFGDLSEPQKLHRAFASRKVKLRLHGTRLPAGYTLALRLTKNNDRSEQPKKPSRKRRRQTSGAGDGARQETDSEEHTSSQGQPRMVGRKVSSLFRLASPPRSPPKEKPTEESDGGQIASASDDEEEEIRLNNAYVGATNDIGSIHQRKWFLSMDRVASGFVKRTKKQESGFVDVSWLPRQRGARSDADKKCRPAGFSRFIVGGRDTERSVVTGRLAKEVLEDEGVVGYVPRGLWRPVLE